MKRSLSFIVLCFFCSSLFMEPILAQAVSQLDVQGLDKKVFIGQAYPSGNIYLECFRRQSRLPIFMPKGAFDHAPGRHKLRARKNKDESVIR